MERCLKRLIENGCVDVETLIEGETLMQVLITTFVLLGRPPLQIALENGSPLDLVAALIDRGSDVNPDALLQALEGLKQTIKHQHHDRRLSDSMDMVELLIDHPTVDVHTVDSEGKTAFDIAYEIGDFEVCSGSGLLFVLLVR